MSLTNYPINFPPPGSEDDRDFLQFLYYRTGSASGITVDVGLALVASGSTQTDALALQKEWNEVGTVAAGTGVLIPPLDACLNVLVFNAGANALKVYPPSGLKIDALATNAAYSLAVSKMQIFRVFSATQIRSMQLG